jgi:hypothetical protein
VLSSPFRDELEALRRENERLRAELARRRRSRPLLGLAIAAGAVPAALTLRPWLNGDSDLRFWAALIILSAVTLTAAWATVGYKRHAI